MTDRFLRRATQPSRRSNMSAGANVRLGAVCMGAAVPLVAAALLSATTPLRAEIVGVPEANVVGIGCVDMETDYVPRVLTCENGLASFEALKAQAVAARTYAYYQLMLRGEIDDGQIDQVYSCSFQPQEIHYLAAADTECEILTYSEPITEACGVISSFYVAGALAEYLENPPFLNPLNDPTNTERFVTYNHGLSGADITQTTLGFRTLNPLDFTDNRGCMSQNGADALSDNSWNYQDILRFYYGEDIEFTTVDDCGNGPSLEGCLPPDCNSNGIDDAEDIAAGTSQDCNGTEVPDECELEGNDCNGNGVPDECDFARLVVFEENFDAPANWSVFSAAGDSTAEDSFDYSVHGIPAAPNSSAGTTRGLKFTVNSNDDTPALDAVSAFPPDVSFSGSYRLEFDMWMNYNGGPSGSGSTGSTEFATFGVNLRDDEVIWTNTADSNGLWFAVTGEGGASQDYRAYRAGLFLSAAEGGFEADSLNASATYYQRLFRASEFETPGAPGKKWVHVEIDRVNGVIEWIINRTLIASRFDDSVDAGNIMLGYMDIFSSISGPEADNYVIYDNVRVTVLDDCDGNGVTDGCDIATGAAPDCNDNGAPDECEIAVDTAADCNDNNIPDECDIASGTAKDCNQNKAPDACDFADQNSDDCDKNGIPDECDIAAGSAKDCNDNDTPDVCDIAIQLSDDCDDNNVPDECEPDCNSNGIADECDVSNGIAADCDANGILDVCEIEAGMTPHCADADSQPDSDGDGVPDSEDQCPQTQADQAVDTNGCSFDQLDDGDEPADQGMPNIIRSDADGDSVADLFDLCPDTPAGTVRVDIVGCALDDGNTNTSGEGAGRPLDTSAECGSTGCGAMGALSLSITLLSLSRMRRRRERPERRPEGI